MSRLAGVKWTMVWAVILVLATVNYADVYAQDKGQTKGDKIGSMAKGDDVAAIPWEKSEIVNHTMKVKSKGPTATQNGVQGQDSEDVYVFHDDGVALIDRDENMCFLCSDEYKWHIDPAGTLILEQKRGNDKITLKKLSSKADIMEVLRNEKPAAYTIAGHPPTIPWTKEEITNHRLEFNDESYAFYDGGKGPASGPFTGVLYLGSAKTAVATLVISWNIDSSGTLHVDSVGSSKDRVMRKISSNEALKNGRRVDYKAKKMTRPWSEYLIIILPIVIVMVLLFVGWRFSSASKADEAVSKKG